MFFNFSDVFNAFFHFNRNLFLESNFTLTLSWRRSQSYRNQSIDLLCKSIDQSLHDWDLRHEKAKWKPQSISVKAAFHFSNRPFSANLGFQSSRRFFLSWLEVFWLLWVVIDFHSSKSKLSQEWNLALLNSFCSERNSFV